MTFPVNLTASEILRKIVSARVIVPVSAEMLGDARYLDAHCRRGQLPIWTRHHVPAARESGQSGTSELGSSVPHQICETVPLLQSAKMFRVTPTWKTCMRGER